MPGELVQQWIKKAEEDWIGLARLGMGTLDEVADLVVFLAEQCAEKYLKALIQQEGAEPPRLHHLSTLLDLLVSVHPDLNELRVPCEQLTPYAVSFRYPGEEASKDEAEKAIVLAGQIRVAVRNKLGLADEAPAKGAE